MERANQNLPTISYHHRSAHLRAHPFIIIHSITYPVSLGYGRLDTVVTGDAPPTNYCATFPRVHPRRFVLVTSLKKYPPIGAIFYQREPLIDSLLFKCLFQDDFSCTQSLLALSSPSSSLPTATGRLQSSLQRYWSHRD